MLRDIVFFTVLGLALLFSSARGQEAIDAAAAVAAVAPAAPAFNYVDTLWVLIAGCLVFFMNAGFAFLEAGFCRAKNVVNILAKNFLVFAMASLAFWAVGYGFMFGEGNAFIGWGSFFVGDLARNPVSNIPLFAFFFFQLAFASAGFSIISGAVAERIKFLSFIVFGTVMVPVLYAIPGHWIWGGGWLSSMGFHDFAGSTVVHSVGGWCALAGILLLGPRLGKYRMDGSVKPIMGHNIPLATLGTFILWLGWFGFNPGSELAMDGAVPRILLITNLAACAGIATSTLLAWLVLGKPDLSMILNGCLAGLVAVTAPCAVITPVGALIIGAIAGLLVVGAVLFFDRMRIDDPVGALAVHLTNGIWGTIAVGLFAKEGYINGVTGLFYGGGFSQLVKQLTGVAAVGAFVFVGALVLWFLIKLVLGLRVRESEEIQGLDIGEMGLEGYSGFQIFLNS